MDKMMQEFVTRFTDKFGMKSYSRDEPKSSTKTYGFENERIVIEAYPRPGEESIQVGVFNRSATVHLMVTTVEDFARVDVFVNAALVT